MSHLSSREARIGDAHRWLTKSLFAAAEIAGHSPSIRSEGEDRKDDLNWDAHQLGAARRAAWNARSNEGHTSVSTIRMNAASARRFFIT